MKRLILIRHAKSDWDDPLDEDHARPLNPRGRRAADTIGGWLKTNSYLPDHVHTSDAARTVETTERLIAAMGTSPGVTQHPKMYHATPTVLFNVLKQGQHDTIALVSHNPGISYFAEGIVAKGPDHPRFLDYPTCATLVCDFDIDDWSKAAPRSGKVVDFVVPKDLTD